jgi:adhesin/invasin
LVSPSSVMTGIPLGGLTAYGDGFTAESQILIDGVPASQTVFFPPGELQAEVDISLYATAATHQISVQDGTNVSNALPLTVYSPQPGPQVMQAIPSFLAADVITSIGADFIVAADVNGDGLSDVIMSGPTLPYSGSITVLNGQSDGTLSAPQYIPCPAADALAAGDIDGNGTTDLVSLASDHFTTTTVDVLLGDGHGNFQPPVAWQTFPGTFTRAAFLADIDGDGKLDLVLAYEPVGGGAPDNLVWLKNTGGSFAAPVILTTSASDNGPFSVADFNHDGKPDILYTLPGSPESLHILFNQGNGQFRDQAVMGTNSIFGPATVIDFNLDGIPDLAIQVPENSGIVELYSFRGNGDGSFSQVSNLAIGPAGLGPYVFVTGDFDHDGFPDLAAVGGTGEPVEMMYLFGNGQGNFIAQDVVGPGGPMAVGDFNGDGIPDIAMADLTNFVSLAVGRTDRNFPSALSLTPAIVGSLSAGDINGDGRPEIFVPGFYPEFTGTVFLNLGNNSFQFGGSTDTSAVMVADLTGRGVVDLLGGDTSFLVWPNNGSLDFSSSPITIPPANGPYFVADMDGDGHPDIVALGQVLYGNGAYQFTAVPTTNSFSAPYVVGDFNGDGKLDIAGGGVTYLNSGGRSFQEVTNSLPLTGGALAVVADFNNDGKDDVAIVLPGDTSISIYYSQGDGTFYQASVIDPGQYVGGLAVGDFNGDGHPDIAAGLALNHEIAILFNNGQGQFTRSFVASGGLTVDFMASDLNGNGKPALVLCNFQVDGSPPNVDVVFHK